MRLNALKEKEEEEAWERPVPNGERERHMPSLFRGFYLLFFFSSSQNGFSNYRNGNLVEWAPDCVEGKNGRGRERERADERHCSECNPY